MLLLSLLDHLFLRLSRDPLTYQRPRRRTRKVLSLHPLFTTKLIARRLRAREHLGDGLAVDAVDGLAQRGEVVGVAVVHRHLRLAIGETDIPPLPGIGRGNAREFAIRARGVADVL